MGVVFLLSFSCFYLDLSARLLCGSAAGREASPSRLLVADASLDHPNIVAVYSVGEERGVHFYAMQLIRGQSLAAVIDQLRELRQQQHPLSASSLSDVVSAPVFPRPSSSVNEPTQEFQSSARRESGPRASDTVPTAQGLISTKGNSKRWEFFRSVAELGIQAAEVFEHAHQQGVIHRDIKPANLMIDANAKLYITDFGLAQMDEHAGITMTGDLIGTLRYMSPEQALGKRVVVDHRADIYALGVSLYELLTTEPAYYGENRADLVRQIAFAAARHQMVASAQILRPFSRRDASADHCRSNHQQSVTCAAAQRGGNELRAGAS